MGISFVVDFSELVFSGIGERLFDLGYGVGLREAKEGFPPVRIASCGFFSSSGMSSSVESPVRSITKGPLEALRTENGGGVGSRGPGA